MPLKYIEFNFIGMQPGVLCTAYASLRACVLLPLELGNPISQILMIFACCTKLKYICI